jgi:hypothetical protein
VSGYFRTSQIKAATMPNSDDGSRAASGVTIVDIAVPRGAAHTEAPVGFE